MITKSFKRLFQKNSKKEAKDNAKESKAKKFLSKLSGSFMLPVSLMSVSGLFIGIGSATGASPDISKNVETISDFFSAIGQPVYDALPALFLVAVIIGFTDDVGTAVFSGLFGFIVFNSVQIPFIEVMDIEVNTHGHLLTMQGAQFLGIHTSEDIALKLKGIVGSNLGYSSLNTSIFGGIVVAFVTIYIYNKYKDIKLPSVIAFFSGKRFVSIVMMIAMIPLALIFLLIWPWIGLGFSYFGEYSGKVAGLDSFIYNFFERALVPFGLHRILSSTLRYTMAGGDLYTQFLGWDGIVTAVNGLAIENNTEFINKIIYEDDKLINYLGDRNGWIAIANAPISKVTFKYDDGPEQTLKIFEFFDQEVGLNLGRFEMTNGVKEFPLAAAALAMVMAAPKERRKEAFSICFPAAVTAIVVGVTEPIEFTFLFLAPVLYWGFHTIMAALLGLSLNYLGVHVGYAGGVIGDISFGVLSIAKGTNIWWIWVMSLAASPIYFAVFYWWIKHFDLATPGRGESTGFITKKVYKEIKAKTKKGKDKGLDPQAKKIVLALGGWDNITAYNNCASRLRYDIKDRSLVSDKALKAAGAFGLVWKNDNHIQVIVGVTAEQLNINIKKYIGSNLA